MLLFWLQTPAQKSLLHSGLRQFLHRMVICLEAEVLPCIPFVLEAILRDQDAFLLSEFMPLVLQVIMKFKVRSRTLSPNVDKRNSSSRHSIALSVPKL